MFVAMIDQQGVLPASPPAKTYKPRILRTASLCGLLIVTLVLIGLVEMACQVLPRTTTGDLLDEALDQEGLANEKRASLNKELTKASSIKDKVTKTIVVTYNCANVGCKASSQQHVPRAAMPQGTSAPNPNAFLQTQGFISETPGASNSFAYLATKVHSSAESTATDGAPIPSVYLQPTATTAPEPNSYLDDPPTAPNMPTFFSSMGPVRTAGDYFLGSYVSTLVAVLYGLAWAMIYQHLLLLEPFYQLSTAQGSLANRTLTRNFSSLTSHLMAFLHGEWTVLIGTVLKGLSLIIITLAPEAISIHTIGTCNTKSKGCTGKIGVLTPAARTIEALLCVIAILTFYLIFALRKRKLNLRANPSSIAGLATLFWNFDIRKDFTSTQPPTTDEQLQRALRAYRFSLNTVTYPDGISLLGFIKESDNNSQIPADCQKHEYEALEWTLKMAPAHRLKASIFFVFLAALATLIVAYRYTGGDNGFETFMDSQGFGVRFLFTLIGVTINLFWSTVFQDTALVAPYCRLAIGHAKAEESILMATPSHPLRALWPAIRNGHTVLALVTTAAILSQILTVTLSTIPFDNANSYNAYVTSTWVSVAIIAIMLFTLGIWFFYCEPNLPLHPNTIAANLFYLCVSRLPDLFATLGSLDTKARDERIRGLNYRYCLAKIQGGDGVVRATVDAEG